MVTGRPYQSLVSNLPEAVTSQRASRKAESGVELDTPTAFAEAEAYLQRQASLNPDPASADAADDAALVHANVCMDKGLSEDGTVKCLFEHWGKRSGFTREQIETKVQNALRYRDNDIGCDVVIWPASLFTTTSILPVSTPTSYPPPKSASVLAKGHFPQPEYVLAGIVLKGLVNLLYGDGGTGKTLLAEHIAVSVAADVPVFGRAVSQLPVLLVLAEDDDGVTKARLEAICFHFGVALADLPITVWSLPGHDVSLAHIADNGTWKAGPFWEPLRQQISEIGPCLVVLDSLADIFALDESKRLPANTAIKRVLGALCCDFRATVLAIAHPSKAAMADGSGYAGSTAWNNAVRNRLTLERTDASSPRRLLKVAKANYGGEAEIELTLNGMVFHMAGGVDERERDARLYQECVAVALRAAEVGTPLQGQKHPPRWALDEIEHVAGRRPTNRELKDVLHLAVRNGDLRYIRGSNHRTAGFYPPDEARAVELACEAKHIQAQEATNV